MTEVTTNKFKQIAPRLIAKRHEETSEHYEVEFYYKNRCYLIVQINKATRAKLFYWQVTHYLGDSTAFWKVHEQHHEHLGRLAETACTEPRRTPRYMMFNVDSSDDSALLDSLNNLNI